MSVTLVDLDVDGTQIVLTVGREDDGTLVIVGHDLGRAPREIFDASEYEYWLRVGPQDAERLQVGQLARIAGSGQDGFARIRAWLEQEGILYTFDSRVGS